MRRTLLIAIAAVLAGGGLVAARFGRSEPDLGETVRVVRAPLERIVVASGTIEPEHLVEVRPKVSGIVERFLVDAGDRVRAGQVIAEIDRETLEAAVREARAIVREAEVGRDHEARELDRKSALFKRGIESHDEIDRVESEH